MMHAVWFCEDDFDGCLSVESEVTFSAFEDGFGAAAAAYGCGKWRVYLLPRDEQEMIEEENVSEVMRALEAVKQ